MAALTNYTENLIINHLFRTETWAKPTTLYIGLMTAVSNGETGSVTEVSGSGYSRVARAPLDANWDAPVSNNGTTANTAVITFPIATGAGYGTVTHFGIWDAPTNGNLMIQAALPSSRTITTGGTPSFPAGTLTFQIDG